MKNLHRELAPISEAAWAEIEQEARRTFRRNIAGRRVVDMPEAAGLEFSALGTGHLRDLDLGQPGVQARRREVLPVVELRVPFTVQRSDVDDVLRGSVDSDWQPVKDAVTELAKAEDRAVFHGYDQLGIVGVIEASSNEPIKVPTDITELPATVAKAVSALRLVGVQGPYALALSAELYTEMAEVTDHGHPILEHVQRVLREGSIIWAPAIEGGVLMSLRGGDFELHLGQDLSIGYLSHDAQSIQLYVQESLTFRVPTAEAAVPLSIA